MTGSGRGQERESIHFKSPANLATRTDALATVLEKSRTDVITEALRTYIDEKIQSEQVERQVGAAFYDDRITMEELVALVGPKEAEGFQTLKRKLEEQPRDLPDPDGDGSGGYPEDFDPQTAPSND